MKKLIKPYAILILCLLVASGFLTGCITVKHTTVEMRDGVNLATDVYLPSSAMQPHGSILIRTPYNKNGVALLGLNWAKTGWPTIAQDVRGRYASEGNDTIFRNDHTDGPDTIAWIGNQSWSNGKVATYGGSALGIVQYLAAGERPADLACQYIEVATPNLYKYAMYPGGEFLKNLVEEWIKSQGATYILPELYAHENYTLDYWGNVTIDTKWSAVNVPAIHLGGWYDCFTQGILDGYMGYQHLAGPGAVGKSKLIMGPWTHGAFYTTKQGELTYPENSIDTISQPLFWSMANQYTMDTSTGYDQWPAVSYYVLGDVSTIDAPGNEWIYTNDWPVPSTSQSWYFQEHGQLQQTLPDDNPSITYAYDPTHPVPTVGGGNLEIAAGPYDQDSVENRSDVLVFTSPVLTQPYEAVGPVHAHLYVSSDCLDTDFTVKLTDVYPDGRSMIIADGILRMRSRDGTDHWEFMQLGTVYGIDVDLWSIAYIWNTGHRIRVDVSSSNFPRFLNNPNTPDGIYKNMTYRIAHNTLYLDSLHPSALILPEIPASPPSTSPNKPSTPVGPGSGKVGSSYNYSSSTVDPDGQDVSLLFNWGDGTSSGWLGPYASGALVTAGHSGKKRGMYNITVKAKDSNGTQSLWSDSFTISMPQEARFLNTGALQMLQRVMDRFPLLKKLCALPFFSQRFGKTPAFILPIDS